MVPSRLYNSEPEILFDLPYRVVAGEKVPLFLLVKDAHRFPVTLHKFDIDIQSTSGKNSAKHTEILETSVQQRLFSKIFYLDPGNFPESGEARILIHLNYLSPDGKKKTLVQDNYRHISHPPFLLYVTEDKLPVDKNWYWGDLHNHSSYTDDQVEFGAPVELLAAASESIGLDFFAVTDHSYDMDDQADNFLKNDPDLGKWRDFQQEVKLIQKKYPGVIILPGEEISTGNYHNQNIHFLLLNNPDFFPGNGDSAENLWENQPTLPLTDILKKKRETSLAIAAHPIEKPPLSQRLILRRGIWEEQDLSHPELDAIQILNGENKKLLEKGLVLWSKLLLQGQKVGVVAGSDSHGNFNCFRQISIPFLKMTFSRQHLFGKVKTGVFMNRFDSDHLIEGIRKYRTVISNGPFASLAVEGGFSGKVGDTVQKSPANRLHITALSTAEFGPWQEIVLIWGNYQRKREIKKSLPVNKNSYTLDLDSEILSDANYVRLEVYSGSGKLEHFCISSPIWFE
jgi:hypothetical protein